MDDHSTEELIIPIQPSEFIERDLERDENRSPSSGDSSGTADSLDDRKRVEPNKRRRRKPAGRLKRKLPVQKAYEDMSFDEKVELEDQEMRKAYAKRQRLSAEGHPIAPYNTTQFLMDDHKAQTPDLHDQHARNRSNNNLPEIERDIKSSEDKLDRLRPIEPKKKVTINTISEVSGESRLTMPKNMSVDSLVTLNALAKAEGEGTDYQDYILQDFSHVYADLHAEELQNLPKNELVAECLKLERQVEGLERKVKSTHRKYEREKQSLAADNKELKEQIQQLQGQLQKLEAAQNQSNQ